MFTTVRVANGYFATYWNGRRTSYMILNGALGISGNGRGSNLYGITSPDRTNPSWIGTLQNAKKHCAKWVKTAAENGTLVYGVDEK